MGFEEVIATVDPSQGIPVVVAINPATNSVYIYNSGAEFFGSAITEFQTAGVGYRGRGQRRHWQ